MPKSPYVVPINNSVQGTVIMDPVAVARFVSDGNGPVMHDLVARATRVQTAAMRQIRLGHVGGATRTKSLGGGAPVRANLRYSIFKRVVPSPVGEPSILVGSENPIALLHHNGTVPHVIRPRNAKMLVFWGGPGNTQKIFARQVNHPGTKPNRYLTDNLHLAL